MCEGGKGATECKVRFWGEHHKSEKIKTMGKQLTNNG
jgi:hypothetical protein